MRSFIAVVTVLSAWPTVARAQTADAMAQAARAFRAGCQSCHQSPDLNLAVDRAWLDQVHRTN